MRGLFPLVSALVICFSSHQVWAQGVQLKISNGIAHISWPAAQGTAMPEYTVQHSTNLVQWKQVGGKLRGVAGGAPALGLSLHGTAPAGFYRILADPSAEGSNETGEGGAEVFGYGARLDQELSRVGFMTIEEFESSFPEPAYLPGLPWDPTTADYWTNFNTLFPLNETELGIFRTNGFVVSERLGNNSFGGSYYGIFHADLPVFITADSVLHAWHRTYVSMLEELEELQLATLMEQVITQANAILPNVWQNYGQGPLKESILDADFYLTVARSLWAAQQVPCKVSLPGQDARVAAMLQSINSLQLAPVPLFGTDRWIDFSQFKARGHYTTSARLTNYFRTMMWLGRTDLRVAGSSPTDHDEDYLRQLGTALVLNTVIHDSGQAANWTAVEKITRDFVGVTDSMTPAQLDDLLTVASLVEPLEMVHTNPVALTNLQQQLLSGELGSQAIIGDMLFAPLSPEELKLPRSFTFFGQKFVIDSWAMSHLVFDRVHWPSENKTPYCGVTNLYGKVVRRKPSSIDVAFSVLGNSQIAGVLAERIRSTNGVPFRDGLPYQHNLVAIQNVIGSQSPAAWEDSMYTAWLAAIRALSSPTVGSEFPDAMRTHAWAMKTVNSQLGSWTELRHDTVLYAKQSYTPPIICSYPFGFVEPRPEFWARIRKVAEVAAQSIRDMPLPVQQVTVPMGERSPYTPWSITVQLELVRSNQLATLQNFGAVMTTLERMAAKELKQEPFDGTEQDFIKSIMEYLGICKPGEVGYTGWYPSLFHKNAFWGPFNSSHPTFQDDAGCTKPDALVTDVHTDLPDDLVCDPGAVIHQGVGSAHLLVIAVNNGLDRRVYAGPVFSHYEFEVPGVNRLSDEEWKARLSTAQKPRPSEWTRGYLVPSP